MDQSGSTCSSKGPDQNILNVMRQICFAYFSGILTIDLEFLTRNFSTGFTGREVEWALHFGGEKMGG